MPEFDEIERIINEDENENYICSECGWTTEMDINECDECGGEMMERFI